MADFLGNWLGLVNANVNMAKSGNRRNSSLSCSKLVQPGSDDALDVS